MTRCTEQQRPQRTVLVQNSKVRNKRCQNVDTNSSTIQRNKSAFLPGAVKGNADVNLWQFTLIQGVTQIRMYVSTGLGDCVCTAWICVCIGLGDCVCIGLGDCVHCVDLCQHRLGWLRLHCVDLCRHRLGWLCLHCVDLCRHRLGWLCLHCVDLCQAWVIVSAKRGSVSAETSVIVSAMRGSVSAETWVIVSDALRGSMSGLGDCVCTPFQSFRTNFNFGTWNSKYSILNWHKYVLPQTQSCWLWRNCCTANLFTLQYKIQRYTCATEQRFRQTGLDRDLEEWVNNSWWGWRNITALEKCTHLYDDT